MTLKDDLERYIDKWYKRCDEENTYIKPIKIVPDGIKCWEYEVNGPHFSLFDRRIIEWRNLNIILNIDESDRKIIDLATIRVAKRLLLNKA